MRKLLFLLTFILAACSGNSDGPKPAAEPVQHFPEILELTLSPETAVYMEGDGNVVVTAEITFSDSGEDIKTLWVRTPDGATSQFDERFFVETGSFTEDFIVPTNRIGAFLIEIWLEDRAGDSSAHRVADFSVFEDTQLHEWTSRLSGLPVALHDVTWDGEVFIAVGGEGAILTSADGIDWLPRESGTGADLFAVDAHGSDIVAVGHEVLLFSADHGQTWSDNPVGPSAHWMAVAINSSHIVVGGIGQGWTKIIVSEDRGDTWQVVDPGPLEEAILGDFVYADGLFVAAADSFFSHDGGWIFVSPDGVVWDESFRSADKGLLAAIHTDDRFVVAGRHSAILISLDGFNWTEIQSPVEGVEYLSAAWNGDKLVLAGGIACAPMVGCPQLDFVLPVGISSTDGGMSWHPFNIDDDYQSHGLAYGNGRFVSVGQSEPWLGEGAIYTTD